MPGPQRESLNTASASAFLEPALRITEVLDLKFSDSLFCTTDSPTDDADNELFWISVPILNLVTSTDRMLKGNESPNCSFQASSFMTDCFIPGVETPNAIFALISLWNVILHRSSTCVSCCSMHSILSSGLASVFLLVLVSLPEVVDFWT